MVHTHLAMQIISSHYNDSFSVIPTIGSRWVFDTKDPFNQIVVQVTNCKRGYVEIGHIIDINGKQELGTFIRRSLLSSDFVKLLSESKGLSRHWFLAPVCWRVPPHSAVTQQGAGCESKVDQGYLVVAYGTHFAQLRLAEASEGFQNLGHCP